MIFYLVTGVISLAVILYSCEVFTNAIEWTGRKFNLNKGVTGSILAALGTALPETIIPIIAILFTGGSHGHEIGIGAILGAPLMLSTLAFGITGIGVLYFTVKKERTPHINVNERILSNDMFFFVIVYILAAGFSFIPQEYKKPFSFIFILIYAVYVWITFLHPLEENMYEELHPLYFAGKTKEPGLFPVLAQDLAALAGIIIGAKFFVSSIEHLSSFWGVSPFIFALFVAPIATELPEKFNSIIWISRRKDTLALGNISGAMVFQSSIVVFVGVAFTDWVLNKQAMLSVGIALLSSLIISLYMKIFKKLNAYILLAGVVFYFIYIAMILLWVK